MGETIRQHESEPIFAIEAETSDADLRRDLAAYRRLTANQRGAYAAELKRKVEAEIAEQRRPSRQRSLSRVRSTLIAFMRSVVVRIGRRRAA
jgi:hypothetical protein